MGIRSDRGMYMRNMVVSKTGATISGTNIKKYKFRHILHILPERNDIRSSDMNALGEIPNLALERCIDNSLWRELIPVSYTHLTLPTKA